MKTSRTQPTSQGSTDSNNPSSSSSGTSDEEQTALSKCQSLASQASSACSQGDDDEYASAAADGLSAACKDLQDSGLSSSKKKNDLAKACQTAYMTCTQTCSGYADTYSESENWSTFNSTHRTCLAYSSRAQQMLKAATASQDSSKAGTNCLSDSSQSPQSAGGDNSKSSSSSSTAAGCTGPNCSTAGSTDQAQAAGAATAEGGFADATAEKKNSGFDVGDTSGATFNNPFGGVDSSQAQAAPRVGTISNNSGGSMPHGGGSPNASAPSNGGGGLWNAMKSALTDIERGLRSGGGFTSDPKKEEKEKEEQEQMVLNGYDSAGRPIYVSSRSPAALRKPEDFKRFLPGGDLFRGIPRGPATVTQIHGPYVDIWSRITNRMIEKCKLGELYDCQLP